MSNTTITPLAGAAVVAGNPATAVVCTVNTGVTPASFRQMFTEFADPTGAASDISLNMYIALAYAFLDPARWTASIINLGVSLYVAHHVALDMRNQAAAAAGGIPGEVVAPKSAKAVDKVSASMDTQAVTMENGAYWNATVYGIRFLWLARQLGAGGIQLGAPCARPGAFPLFVAGPFL
jgi:fermentation-respiration switch protein FrsA (DUF1100 family)